MLNVRGRHSHSPEGRLQAWCLRKMLHWQQTGITNCTLWMWSLPTGQFGRVASRRISACLLHTEAGALAKLHVSAEPKETITARGATAPSSQRRWFVNGKCSRCGGVSRPGMTVIPIKDAAAAERQMWPSSARLKNEAALFSFFYFIDVNGMAGFSSPSFMKPLWRERFSH